MGTVAKSSQNPAFWMEWLWFWCWLCYLLTVQPRFGLNKWGLQQVLLYPALSVGCSHASLPGMWQSCQEVSSLSLSFLSDFMTRCFLCMRTRPSRWWTLCLPLLSSNVCSLAGGMWCIVWRPLRTSEVLGGQWNMGDTSNSWLNVRREILFGDNEK